MADVDNGDILRLGAGLSFEGVYDVVNVFHVVAGLDVGLDWAAATSLIQNYVDDLYDEIKAVLNDSIGTNVVSVGNVTQVTTLGSVAFSPTWAGTEGGEATAPGVACFAWGRTYTPRVQIRKYFGVFGESDCVDGVWNVDVRDAVEALMEKHIVERVMATGKTFTGVAYNRTLGTYTLAHSVASAAEPAYQRRRRRGRGS